MEADRLNKLRDLFDSAVRLDGDARRAFMDEACADDPHLRRELEDLLASAASAGDPDLLDDDCIDRQRAHLDRMLAASDGERAAAGELHAQTQDLSSPLPPGVPPRIGRYHIKRVIATGGMGTVYEAMQDKPRRAVALKLLRAGITSRSALRRFEYEAQVLGRLRHPGIAQVYDAGTHRDGNVAVPYFAMEYIPGARSIIQYAAEKRLGTRERLELFDSVCEAVHHGHQKGIIHRDLKPGNILVDGAGRAKVIDFGVARSTDSDMAVTTLQTDVGQLIGTLQYMSPEQCAADPNDIDTRSDVYALGVILYELLTGKLPYDISRAAIYEATRVIREQVPTSPSTVDRALRGDIETITLKALEKDRERRYESAAALAGDIRRYLADEPILARPPSMRYHARQFIRRNKPIVAGVAAVFVVLLGGIIASTTFAIRAERARAETARTVQELAQVAAYQEAQLSRIDPQLFGNNMRSAILNERRSAMELAGKPQGEIDTAVASLTEGLHGLNFTNAALATVDENIFQRSLKTIDEQFADQPLVRARMLFALGKTMTKLGLIDKGVAALFEAHRLRQSLLGGKHPDTLIALAELGVVKADQAYNARPLDFRKRTECLEMIREAVAGMVEVLGPNHPTTLEWQAELARFLKVVNNAEAKALLASTLERAESALGPRHHHSLQVESRVGLILL